MADLFVNHPETLDGPASRLAAITPNDSTDLAVATRAIYVGGAGNIALIGVDDTSSVILQAVPVGTLIPVRARRVLSTGTTATNLIGLT